jgi:hypothetical protein
MRILIAALAAASLSTWALAQSETVEELASEEEVQAVTEAIAKIGCTAEQIEKENDELFEIDDAECEIGQYDIKLDGEYNITVMTRD